MTTYLPEMMLSHKLSATAMVGLCALVFLSGPMREAQAQEKTHGNVAVEGTRATPDDPENLAQYGYSPKEIQSLYRARRRDAQNREARKWIEQGKFADAIAQYKVVLTEDESETNAWLGLAEAYAASGDIKQAIGTYRFLLTPELHPHYVSSVETDPRNVEQFALLLHQNHYYDEAWAVHQRAMQLVARRNLYGTELLKDIPITPQTAATAQLPFIAHLVISAYNLRSSLGGPPNAAKAAFEAREALRLRPNQAIGHLYLGYALAEQARASGKPNDRLPILLWEQALAELEAAAQTGNKSIAEAAEKAKVRE